MKSSTAFHGNGFPTTRWSHVLMAAGQVHSQSRAALNELCRKYWRPIYAFARQRGLMPQDAEDLTQSYLSDLLQRGYIQKADQARGRFRAFLIQDVKFFIANHQAGERAQKRGGRVEFISINTALAESRIGPADPAWTDSDAYFDRQWALETVRMARESVGDDYRRQGKESLFTKLQSGLVSTPTAAVYAQWQEALGMNEGALKVALHRLRERFRSVLEELVLETVSSPEDLKDEMRHLREALSKSTQPK